MKGVPYTKALMDSKYWESVPLEEMNTAQWEAICDGCGRCCLHKFVDSSSIPEDTEVTAMDSAKGEVVYTNITCFQLNEKTCACKSYEKRQELVPDCVSLSKDNLEHIHFMPPSCSYRRLYNGQGLASWHPMLNKGKKTKMHELGITVRNKVVSEEHVDLEAFEDYIVTWPLSQID